VLDLRSQPIPVARHHTRISGAAGGVHVRLSPFDARVVDIKFFDRRGLDLDKGTERKIEGLFFREDFRRVYLDDVGRIEYASDVEASYGADFLKHLDVEAIRNADDYNRIAVDYANSSSSLVLPVLLGRLNADVVAINAVVQEQSLYQTPEEFQEGMLRLGAITRTLHAAFGVRLDTGGERIYFVDESGEAVTGMTALAVITDLALAHHHAAHGPGGIAVVPVYAPSVFDTIGEKYEAEIVRTRFNSYALMTAALPYYRPAISMDRPDVFGSVALPIAHTSLDRRWRKVANAPVGAASGAYASGLVARSPLDKLEAVNRYVNARVSFVDDIRQYGVNDLWTSAADTLRRGRGDCEDYAIAKLQLLRRAGFAEKDLYLVILRDALRRADHAVLVARADGRLLVLDNGTDRLIDSYEMVDYHPIVTFSGNRIWTHGYRREMPPVVYASNEAGRPNVTVAAASVAAVTPGALAN
jgi:predicted transglutaminase-like cysteine proteinase